MPRPQSTHRARPASNRKRFTLAEANAALPLVRRIVEDIVATHTRVLEVQEEIDSLTGKAIEAARDEMENCWQRLQDYVDELTEIGCELKDFRLGLVDFTTRHQNRDVHLCWKLGEESIEHFHELDGGFSGRQPISKLEPDAVDEAVVADEVVDDK